MLYAAPLSSLPAESLLELALVSSMLAVATGYVADAILGDRGFGTLGNGFLAFLGAMAGYGIVQTFPAVVLVDPFLAASLTSLTCAVALLILVATIKNRLLE